MTSFDSLRKHKSIILLLLVLIGVFALSPKLATATGCILPSNCDETKYCCYEPRVGVGCTDMNGVKYGPLSCVPVDCSFFNPVSQCSYATDCGTGMTCNNQNDDVPIDHGCGQLRLYGTCQTCPSGNADCDFCPAGDVACAPGGVKGCEANINTEANNCGSCGNDCTTKADYCSGDIKYQYTDSCVGGSCAVQSLGCQNECCAVDYSCQGSPATCKLTQLVRPPCIDSDNDNYYANAEACIGDVAKQDCNDDPVTGASVYPGSCSSSAITWSSCGATSTTGGCGSGTCSRSVTCQPGQTKEVTCDNGGTSTVTCSLGCVYDAASCGSFCGDGTCNDIETRDPTSMDYCPSDCGFCGDLKVQDPPEKCDPPGQTGLYQCGGGTNDVWKTCVSGSRADTECQWSSDCNCKVAGCKTGYTCNTVTGGCDVSTATTACSDGTAYSTCSATKPKYCDSTGALPNKCGTCGCPSGQSCQTDGSCTPISCTNLKKDGTETGIDCGGNCPAPSCSKTLGVCAGKTKTCSASGWVDCTAANYGANYEAVETKCDGLDNNCNGQVDEPAGCTAAAATCTDGIKNQNELGIDCGGICTACAPVITCGNRNQLDAGEQCDGTNLNGQTCVSQGYLRGELKCGSNCNYFDASSCTNTACPITYPSQCGKINPVKNSGIASTSLRPLWVVDEELYYTTPLNSDTTLLKKAGFEGGFELIGYFYGDPVSMVKFNDKIFMLKSADSVFKERYSEIFVIEDAKYANAPYTNVLTKVFSGYNEPVTSSDSTATYHRGAFGIKLLVAGGKLYSLQNDFPSTNLSVYRYNEQLERFTYVTTMLNVSKFVDAVSLNGKIYVLSLGPGYDLTQSCGDLSKPRLRSDYELRSFDGSSVSLISKKTTEQRWALSEDGCSVSGIYYGPNPQSLIALNGKLYISEASTTAINAKALAYNPADWSVAASFSWPAGEGITGLSQYGLTPSVIGNKAYIPILTVNPYTHKYGYGLLSFDGTAYSIEAYTDIPGGLEAISDCLQSVVFGYSAASSNAIYVSSAIENLQAIGQSFSSINILTFGIGGEDRVCCEGNGKEWLKSGERDKPVDGQFKDVLGQRTAPDSVRLLPKQQVCSDKPLFFKRDRNCLTSKCTSYTGDKAMCDKQSDCVYNGKCYSDVKAVAATYFGNDASKVLKSAWKDEVSVDLDSDGKPDMMCDPGQWVGMGGTVSGTVTDKTSGAPIVGAFVAADSTNQEYQYATTTVDGGTYAFSSMEATNYDFTASKAGYVSGFENNFPVQPSKNVQLDFQLDRATSNVTGYVTNISQSPEPNAVASALVRVVGTAFMAVTDASGKYSITEVPQGTYDFVASKVSDGYQDATKLSVPLSESKASVNFTLLRSLGNCNNDCTVGSSNVCDASCNGKGLCLFDSDATKQACDGTFGLVKMPDGKYVECCKGKPYMPTKANMIVPSDNVIVTRVPVLFKGKFLNLVIAVFNKK